MSESDNFVLETSFAYQTYVLARALRKDFFKIGKSIGYDLFPEQWFVLYVIAKNPGQSQSQLAAHAFEDKPSLSRTLSSMENKGLVRSNKDTNDRRITRYFLTDAGKEVYNNLVKAMKLERNRVYADLTPSDYAHFERIVQILIRNMG